MNEMTIVKADQHSVIGGLLNRMAIGNMANALAGSREEHVIDQTFRQLWSMENNRFSHKYAFEARMGGQTLGMITCYPVTVLNRLAWPTFKQIFSIRKWALLGYNLMNPKGVYSMLTMQEGQEDEFHIGTIAALPESRGMGIGSRLFQFAEQLAVQQGFAKSSLTVRQDNHLAIKLYERLGYHKVAEIKKPALSLYRMAKKLT